MSGGGTSIRASIWLERALIFTFIMHGLAMLSMAALLIPGMSGGTAVNDAARIAYIADHPWLWRLGWLPWQLTALSDVLLAIALVCCNWIPKLPSILVLLLTMVAIYFEQPGEFWWVTDGIRLAQEARASGNLNLYLAVESEVLVRVSAWAALFYSIAAMGWSWCFARAGTWSRALTVMSVITWGVLCAVSIAPLLPPGTRPGPEIISLGNALGFILMMLWFVLLLEAVFRRSRPVTAWGRDAVWRHPAGGLWGRALDLVGNSRLLRRLGELMPSLAFVSDITDVIYVNYLVDADRLLPLVPRDLELDRLGVDGRFAFFTFLTYNHGHFGPRILGPLRRLLPSPVQSNWRIHVTDKATGKKGVYFVMTATDRTLNALAARLLSEGVAMHVCKTAKVARNEAGEVSMLLDPGDGTAPDVAAVFTPAADRAVHAEWIECFGAYAEVLAYCVPQDRVLVLQDWYNRLCRHEIELGIPLEACEPLTGTVKSLAAERIVGDAKPLCFRVPRVNFVFSCTEYDAL